MSSFSTAVFCLYLGYYPESETSFFACFYKFSYSNEILHKPKVCSSHTRIKKKKKISFSDLFMLSNGYYMMLAQIRQSITSGKICYILLMQAQEGSSLLFYPSLCVFFPEMRSEGYSVFNEWRLVVKYSFWCHQPSLHYCFCVWQDKNCLLICNASSSFHSAL